MRLLLTRLAGVVRKELVEVIRQPGMLFVLVVGPLLILLLFGSGVRSEDPAVRSIFVAPEGDEELAEVVREYADSQSERLTITDVTTNRADAVLQLRRGEVDLVVIFPGDPAAAVEENERAAIQVLHRFIDPLESQAIALFTRGAVDDLNDILLSLVIDETQTVAGEALREIEAVRSDLPGVAQAAVEDRTGLDDLEVALADAEIELETLLEIDPEIVAAPLEGESESIGGRVTVSQFYAPAVVALILQHLTLTFVALARSRERELGTDELLTVSPLRPAERIAGQGVAYLLLGTVLGAVLLAAVVLLLGAPLRSGIWPVAVVVLLELLAAIGLGLLLSRLARTTTQVVQGSMLLLLLSVFFGGLLLSPERLLPWARPIGWVLPMTHALTLLRDTTLRGFDLAAGPLLALVAMSVLLIGGTVALAQRNDR